MFDQLQDKFSRIFKVIKGHGKISEKNISDAVREIRIALLESDVNFKVVSKFIAKVKEKAFDKKVLDSITPGQQFIKVVLDELIAFLSSDDLNLKLKNKGVTKIVIAGLQGSGKTTTSAKIASFLKREYKKNPLVIGADLQRPAAQKQLKLLCNDINVDFYTEKIKNPVKVIKNSLEYAVSNKNDVVIIDTSGRLHIDEKLLKELELIIKASNPDEVLYVVDGMTGQDAINSSKVFSEKCKLTGTIITKMDGNSGGGAALSIKEITRIPIKFMTSGENMLNIEKFDPERIGRRILGLGDIIGFVEKAQHAYDFEKNKKIQDKINNNEINFNDFLEQINQFNKMGSMKEMLKFFPGGNKIKNFNIKEKQLIWIKAIINSMTNEERKKPELINGSRRARIADGSGRNVGEVNRLIKQFNQFKLMIKKANKMKLGKFPFNLS